MSRWTGTDSCLSLTGKQGLTGEGCGDQSKTPSSPWDEQKNLWTKDILGGGCSHGLQPTLEKVSRERPSEGYWANQTGAGNQLGWKLLKTETMLPVLGVFNTFFLLLLFYFPCVPWGLLQTRKGLDAPRYGYSYVLVYMGLNQHRIKIYRAKIYPSCKVPTIKQ